MIVDTAPPSNIRRLPHDGESFVPWFAIGQDERLGASCPHPMRARALAGRRCWLCGRALGEQSSFVLPLRGALERQAGDPPAHWHCALYAVEDWWPGGRIGWYWPNDENDRLLWLHHAEDDRRGMFADRVVCLWRTEDWIPQACNVAIGEPVRVEWYQGGRRVERLRASGATISLGSLAERQRLLTMMERLRPWLP